jgi:sialate O-acetylesterase
MSRLIEHSGMNTKSFFSLLGCIVLGTVLFSFAAEADESLAVASAFGDHMVFQRGMDLPVWGIAEPGSKVTVSFGKQRKETNTRADGKWRIVLDSMEASAKPSDMRITSGAVALKFEDVLVGEVWICSGQSNMQFKLSSCVDAESEIASSDHPELRLNTAEGWSASSPESVPGFSGVAYFFGRKLHVETGVPVGLIARALGGTPVEWWTPVDKLRRVPFAKAALANPSEKWMKYEQAVAQWQKNVKASDRKAAGKKPEAVGSPEEQVLASIYAPGKAGSLYVQHLEPIAGYGIRGAIWYQGERNSKAGKKASRAYRPLLANMITSWREEWGQGDFPFLAVQLPTFSGGSEGWAIVQDGQAAAVSDVPNAGYIDISDQPDDGLHPKNKKPVGERLADLALEEFLD